MGFYQRCEINFWLEDGRFEVVLEKFSYFYWCVTANIRLKKMFLFGCSWEDAVELVV